MTEPITVLLTAQDPALIPALQRVRPQLRAMTLGSEIPETRFDGPVWCFVDWLLPEISGLEMVRRLREAKATRHSHITMVLEEGDPEERRRALKAGADDYLVGPLSPRKLAERLDLYEGTDASPAAPRARLTNGGLSMDLAAHQLRYNGTPIALRPNEFRLLAHFMEHPDQVFSRAALIDRLGKDEEAIDERTVDVWVGRLRRALTANGAPDPLRTVRSLGYVMDSLGE
ncbi:winged helix-turn-helix domain-containing protein [Novosphingobium sp.]|uniref:winged helix-turn-helix domain-containing protein n=1 Tax=Novosphingobium sp. TaxID=1874826 RepID=UPI0035AF36F8